MQLYAILNELWRRRLRVGLALIVSVLVGLMVGFKISPGLPPHLSSRQHEVGVASTRVLINTPSSIVADLNPAGGSSLATHAQLLGNVISSEQVHNALAKRAGLPPSDLTIAPLAVGGVIKTPLAVTAPAPVGASSVSVNADPLLPLITITATAPTPKLAASLANGSVSVLQSYVQRVAAEEGIAPSRRPVITSLGSAVGVPSTSGPSKMYSALAIILLFGFSCYVILVASGGKARLREFKELRALERERALALVFSEGQEAGPVTPSTTATPPIRDGSAVDGPSPSPDLRQFDAGAGLLTVSDDLRRRRAVADEASALGELRADANNRSTHTSPHHRAVRAVPGRALFSRFSRNY